MAGTRRKTLPVAPIDTVEDYLKAKTRDWRTEGARTLLSIMAEAAPEATVSIKWGQPVWELRGPLVWMRAATKHLSFGFWRGADLQDPHGVLEGEGLKMRHVKINSLAEIPHEALKGLIAQAVTLNRGDGDATRPR